MADVTHRLKQLIRDGEGLTVEFKRYENAISNSVYETVSSFSNRYGGYLLLKQQESKIYTMLNCSECSIYAFLLL